MRKYLRLLLMGLMALCFSLPCLGRVEAATIALLPLINNVEGQENAGTVYYQESMEVINEQEGLLIVENDRLLKAIEAARIGNQVPTSQAMAKICRDGNVDIVIAMQLDTLKDAPFRSGSEDTLELFIKGVAVSYNRLNGKTYRHKIYVDDKVPEVLGSRWNLLLEEWGRQVRLEICNSLGIKKALRKPRIGF